MRKDNDSQISGTDYKRLIEARNKMVASAKEAHKELGEMLEDENFGGFTLVMTKRRGDDSTQLFAGHAIVSDEADTFRHGYALLDASHRILGKFAQSKDPGARYAKGDE